MLYPSIRIEGSIFSPDILDRLDDVAGQRPADFGLESNAKVKDEIARAWADAQDYWRIFQRKLENIKQDSAATTETRNNWIVPLLGLMGYQLEYQARGVELNGKNYPISHRVTNRGNTPVHVVGYREPSGLDRKPEKAVLRMSAHAMLQEYLNLQDELYGLVTNGRVLRLLRDSSRLIKLTYLEFDLDRIFTDGLFADFAVLYRLLHSSRLPSSSGAASESLIERYHQDSIEQGTRIRDGLRIAVTEALQILGTGFLTHPENTALRDKISKGEIRPEAYFNYLLRVIYRLLFLMVTEERGLVFPKSTVPGMRKIYSQHYSVHRLRRMAVMRGLKEERHYDGWQQLLSTFQIFERQEIAEKFGTTALNGHLFNPDSLSALATCRLSNAALFTALERLCYFNHPENGQRMPVNFGALATEEFGSVYESLLELHPVIEQGAGAYFGFRQAAGNERKTSGSYYTPPELVDCLLDSALDPVIEDRIKNYSALGYDSAEDALLAIKVCDPACGSGHFLIAAAQRIGRAVAILRSSGDEPAPDVLRYALRAVIGHCIHGVDVNPMSVELCKVALWLEAVEPGKPLTFLDHHIRWGNSLLGAMPAIMKDGIPQEAYQALTGDEKPACAELKKRNKRRNQNIETTPLFSAVPTGATTLEVMPDDTLEQIKAKQDAFISERTRPERIKARQKADLFCAAFVAPKTEKALDYVPLSEDLDRLEQDRPMREGVLEQAQALAREYRFFHWHLEFPAVFTQAGTGGFDVMLGNPPWDKIQPEEEKFFAISRPDIATAESAKIRKDLIARLERDDQKNHLEWTTYKRRIEGLCHFLRNSETLKYTSDGNLNSYRVFTELSSILLNKKGRAGLVIQTGLATDESGKEFFDHLVAGGQLRRFLDFENRNKFFDDVDSRFRFSLATISGTGEKEPSEFGWLLHSLDELDNSERIVRLAASDLIVFNPVSKTCPVLLSNRELKIGRQIYQNAQYVYISQENRLGTVDFLGELFNMTRDSRYFKNTHEENTISLYEAKFINHFDHRFATYQDKKVRDTTIAQKASANFYITPKSYVDESEVLSRTTRRGIPANWMAGFRSIASPTNERTSIFAIFPFSAVGNSINMVLGLDAYEAAFLMANANSWIFDYCARQKLSGSNVNIWIFKQLPAINFEHYKKPCPWSAGETLAEWILQRVLELTYTAWDLEAFARDCGFDGSPFRWDENRRFQLRCELDAAFFHLYGIGREDVDYIMETFPIVKRKDEAAYGNYRTKDTILLLYDAMAQAEATGQPFVSALNPPAADVRCCHPARDREIQNLIPGAWARPMRDQRTETGAMLTAIIKVLDGPTPIRQVRLAAIWALEPRLLLPYIDQAEAAVWRQRVGSEAEPLPASTVAFVPAANSAWGDAVRQLRATGLLVENLQANTWAPGTGLGGIDTSGWADGRARMVLEMIRRTNIDIDEVIQQLPDNVYYLWEHAEAA